jgi:3-deoxy-D-manno-octulosonic-acid transferase
VLLHLGALVCLPFWVFVRLVRGRYRGQFLERMAILSPGTVERLRGGRTVWIHAASAGETASAVPLVRRLKSAFPASPILFTVTSRYGKEMAAKQLAGVADAVCFSPLDLPTFVRRYLAKVDPILYVMVETDLWPNMVRKAKRRGIPVVLASGHASARAGWRLLRPFGRAVLSHVDAFLMQSEADVRNILDRGAPPDRVLPMGNLKFDGTAGLLGDAERARLRELFRIPAGAPVLVAGSTLEEDEAPVLDAVAALRREGTDLHAVVAPRKRERAEELRRGCAARGLPCALRTGGGGAPVLILDTMGELARAYNLAEVAYVGGGLTPEVGLHNILEPVVCGVPVVFGSHHGKAARIAAEFLRHGAGVEVRDGTGLLDALRTALTDVAARERLRRAGSDLLRRHQGAAERQALRIRELVR